MKNHEDSRTHLQVESFPGEFTGASLKFGAEHTHHDLKITFLGEYTGALLKSSDRDDPGHESRAFPAEFTGASLTTDQDTRLRRCRSEVIPVCSLILSVFRARITGLRNQPNCIRCELEREDRGAKPQELLLPAGPAQHATQTRGCAVAQRSVPSAPYARGQDLAKLFVVAVAKVNLDPRRIRPRRTGLG